MIERGQSMKSIDLHVHSTASDGTLTPSEVALYAHSKGLSAIALTDHDTVDGIDECQSKGKEVGVTVIPGIEFSADFYGKELHILGYYINHHDKVLKEKLEGLIAARDQRNHEMLKKLEALGMPMTMDDLLEDVPLGTVLTRAHFAKAMLKKGYIKDRNEAFTHYIGGGKPAFVPKQRFMVKECIDLIHKAGGLAVLAHPLLYGYDQKDITQVLRGLKNEGLDGAECIYSTHTKEDTAHLLQVCSNLKLLPTGGSDFHGQNKPLIDLGTGYGELSIPFDLLEAMQKHLGLYFSSYFHYDKTER